MSMRQGSTATSPPPCRPRSCGWPTTPGRRRCRRPMRPAAWRPRSSTAASGSRATRCLLGSLARLTCRRSWLPPTPERFQAGSLRFPSMTGAPTILSPMRLMEAPRRRARRRLRSFPGTLERRSSSPAIIRCRRPWGTSAAVSRFLLRCGWRRRCATTGQSSSTARRPGPMPAAGGTSCSSRRGISSGR